MPEISVDVAGRNHRLVCGAGEEEHLTQLAKLIDREATALSKGKAAQMPEGRLMLMAALMVADRLHDALLRVEELERQQGAGAGDPERAKAMAERTSALARRAETLADELAG